MKRLFDFFLALIGIFVSLPLWLIFIFLIWLDDRSSIFYSQERIGRRGEVFKVLKFRSMVRGAEKYTSLTDSAENERWVTKIGRILRVTAMDELPQLINILKGEMSFVGPRPPLPEETRLGQEDIEFRLKARPGLTGVAQILIYKDAPMLEKAQYDIWYIKNHSLSLDLYLIMLSFLVTFRARWEVNEDKISLMAERLKKRIERQIQ